MRKIKIGIIGAGSFSEFHLEGLERIKEAEVLVICDLDEENARAKAEKYNIPMWCTDYNEILNNDEIDAVIVITGDHLSMDKKHFEKVDKNYTRTVFNTFLNTLWRNHTHIST